MIDNNDEIHNVSSYWIVQKSEQIVMNCHVAGSEITHSWLYIIYYLIKPLIGGSKNILSSLLWSSHYYIIKFWFIHYIIERSIHNAKQCSPKNKHSYIELILCEFKILFAFGLFVVVVVVALFQYYLARKILWEVHLGNIQIKLLEINHGKKWCVPLKWKLHHINNRISICEFFILFFFDFFLIRNLLVQASRQSSLYTGNSDEL